MRALLVVAVACGPSQAEMERANTTALAQANARATEHVTAFTPATLQVVDPSDPHSPEDATAPAVRVVKIGGLLDTEHLGVTGDGVVVLLGRMCVGHGRCDTCYGADYKFGHAADGHVVIARLRPSMRVVRTVDDDTCSASCSGGAPKAEPRPEPATGTVLGAVDPRTIEIRDAPYVVEVVDRRCTNTTPVP